MDLPSLLCGTCCWAMISEVLARGSYLGLLSHFPSRIKHIKDPHTKPCLNKVYYFPFGIRWASRGDASSLQALPSSLGCWGAGLRSGAWAVELHGASPVTEQRLRVSAPLWNRVNKSTTPLKWSLNKKTHAKPQSQCLVYAKVKKKSRFLFGK